MTQRRFLSLWFPRLGAERCLRLENDLADLPFAILQESGQAQRLSSLSHSASLAGLYPGQSLRDAQAICPKLITRMRNIPAEHQFLLALCRWGGKFSPWITTVADDGLCMDITGCAHLFGGEDGFVKQIASECEDFQLSTRLGLADTIGAAWALAHYHPSHDQSDRNVDALTQEARATRVKLPKQRFSQPRRQAQARASTGNPHPKAQIAPLGGSHSALAALPVAALRLESSTIHNLHRVGLRQIGDLSGQPRAALARRFGKELMLRLDQALGRVPEPLSAQRTPPHFGVRMSLPDPIGLADDLRAALDRLLPRLCDKLRAAGQGARQIDLQVFQTDQTLSYIRIQLAQAGHTIERIRPLLLLKLETIDMGFGIDMLRLEASQTEPITLRTTPAPLQQTHHNTTPTGADTDLNDLIGRLGTRIGLDHVTRLHPAESHIAEKTAVVFAAAWSKPAPDWPRPDRPRPKLLWPPEPISAKQIPDVPPRFRWRNRVLTTAMQQGPERIAPEWWLDDPNWRSGVRDYWRINCAEGDQLWVFFAHGGARNAGWYCQGSFT